MLSSKSDNIGGRVGQGDLSGEGRPATQRGALQVKTEEHAAKKALDGAAFAEFFFSPGGRKAGAVFLSFGVPGNDGNRAQNRMDPDDEAKTPVGGIQADDARADLIQAHCPFQEWLGERSIVDVGRREQKEERQA